MSSIEDVKQSFKSSLENDEPKTNVKSNKKYFLILFAIVVSGIMLNYYYSGYKNDAKKEYLPPDARNILSDVSEEDQDPLFQKF